VLAQPTAPLLSFLPCRPSGQPAHSAQSARLPCLPPSAKPAECRHPPHTTAHLPHSMERSRTYHAPSAQLLYWPPLPPPLSVTGAPSPSMAPPPPLRHLTASLPLGTYKRCSRPRLTSHHPSPPPSPHLPHRSTPPWLTIGRHGRSPSPGRHTASRPPLSGPSSSPTPSPHPSPLGRHP
jgi:hypothetical protein